MYRSFAFAPLLSVLALGGCVSEEDAETEFRTSLGGDDFGTAPDNTFYRFPMDGPGLGGTSTISQASVSSAQSEWNSEQTGALMYERDNNTVYNGSGVALRTISTTFTSTQFRYPSTTLVDYNLRLHLQNEWRVYDGSGTTTLLYVYDGRQLKRSNGELVAEFELAESNLKEVGIAVYDTLLSD